MKKKFKSNADRQKAYRARHRNANATVSAICAPRKAVTDDPRDNDPRWMRISDDDGYPCFAYIANKSDGKRPPPGQAFCIIDFEANTIEFCPGPLFPYLSLGPMG